MAEYALFYLWAIRLQGDTNWQYFSSSGVINRFGNLLFSQNYEIMVRVYGNVKYGASLKPPRTDDFREVDAWQRGVGYTGSTKFDVAPTITGSITGANILGAWIESTCTASLYATEWSAVSVVTSAAKPIPSQVTGVTVESIGTWIDPQTGVTLSRAKITWTDNAASEYVDLYEVLWTE